MFTNFSKVVFLHCKCNIEHNLVNLQTTVCSTLWWNCQLCCCTISYVTTHKYFHMEMLHKKRQHIEQTPGLSGASVCLLDAMDGAWVCFKAKWSLFGHPIPYKSHHTLCRAHCVTLIFINIARVFWNNFKQQIELERYGPIRPSPQLEWKILVVMV